MALVKILVSYHDKHRIFKSDILTPIQTGAALASECFPGMLHDDDGKNISAENPRYAELSAQYWAWKNYQKLGNPDYIGFMHYRRHFIFNEANQFRSYHPELEQCYQLVYFHHIRKSYFKDIGLTDDNILRFVPQYDCICVKEADFSKLGIQNSVEDYKNRIPGSNVKDLELFFKLIETDYPQYMPFVKRLQTTPYKYLYNMFIMRRELFESYNEFLFAVLDKLDKQIDTTHYTPNYKRVLGYLGEFCLSVFINKLKSEEKWKIKEVYCSFCCDTRPQRARITRFFKNYFIKNNLGLVKIKQGEIMSFEPIVPAFKHCSYVIGMSSSNQYAPYLAVYLQSIIDHAKEENLYDIVVFETDMSAENKKRIRALAHTPNFSIRFYNLQDAFGTKLYVSQHYFAKQCYYRLALGEVFKKYQKAIFTDIDLAAVSDIFELFKIDMQGKPIAACEEILWHTDIRAGKRQHGFFIDDYLEKIGCFGLYYNTGVVVADIARFNETAGFQTLLQTAQENKFINLEQDVLNKVFNNNFYTLPPCYNFEVINGVFEGKTETFKNYAAQVEEAKIYHYLAADKVWFFPNLPKGYIWWQIARRTSYYEEIWANYMRFYHQNFMPNYLKYLKYHFFSKFVFGKMKKRYLRKADTYLSRIK